MATLDKLGENHDVDLAKAKERICQDTSSLKQAQAIHSDVLSQHASHENCTNACHKELISSTRKVNELKKTFHPGFVISFDNIDVQLQRKNMTMHSQNQDFHWVNHQMVKNRVSGVQLDSLRPKANLQEVSNLKFIPSIEDQQQQRTNYIIPQEFWFSTSQFYSVSRKHVYSTFHTKIWQKCHRNQRRL